jgi:ribosomal protein S18 acetylase RimI-like enzyme
MGLIIRSAVATDALAVGNLAKQFAEYLRTLGDHTDFKFTAEAFLRDGFGLRPSFRGVVAEEDSRVIGYLLYHLGYDSDGAFGNMHVVDLYVDYNARNKGVGRALMAAAADIARKSGSKEMVWSVYHANDLAARFYERLGAERITEVFFMKIPADAL